MEKDFQYYKKWAISYLDAELKSLTATKEINKGSIALPVGTISTWNGVEYIKTAAGKWIRYLSGKLNEKKEKIKQAIKEIDKTTDFTELETTCKKYSQLFRRKNGTYPEEYKEIEKAAYRKTLYLMDQYKKEHLAKGGFGMKDDKFESIKAKVIAHLEELENQENNEKKAIKKSLLEAESMEKSGKGLPVGTVREWKGKKYVKIAPGKWKPKYDSESRGAKMAVAAIKKKAQACKDGKELMQLMLENRDRFSDANGRPLPFVKELSEYISSMNDSIESKKEPEKKAEKTEPKAKKEEPKEPEDKKEEPNHPEEKQNYKVVDADGKEISNTDAKNNYKKNVEQIKFFEDSMKDLDKHEEGKFEFTINYLKKYNDDILSKLNDSDKKEVESYKPGKGISKKIELGNLSNEGIGASDTVDIGVRIASDTDRMLKRELQDAHSDVFRYGDKFKDRIGQIEYAIGVKDKIKNFDNLDTKEQSDLINDLEHIIKTAKGLERGYGKDESKRIVKENMSKVVKEMKSKMKDKEKNKNDSGKSYWVVDSKGNRLTNEDAKNKIIENEMMVLYLKSGDEPRKDIKIRELKNYNDYLIERLSPDDAKAVKFDDEESESEKRQNRSDAMKGNKNAYKGGSKDEPSEKKYSPEAEKTIKNFEKRIADIDDKLKMFDNNPGEASQRMSKQYEKQKKELQKELDDFKKNAGGNKESGADKGSEAKNEGKRDIKETKRLYNEAREKLHNLDKERDKLKRNGGDYTKNDKEISNLESKISEYGREIQDEENINNLRSSLEHYISHRNYTKDLEDKNKKPEVTWNRFVSKYLVGYSTSSKDLYSDNGFDRAIKDIKNAKNIPDDVKKMLTESVEKYKQYYSGDSKKESGTKDSAFKGTNLETVVEKYAKDKDIKNYIKKTDVTSFVSDDATRFFMQGVYHDDGYKIATDARVMAMIKEDYPKENEKKIKGSESAIKSIESSIKNAEEKINTLKVELERIGSEWGVASNRYKNKNEEIEEEEKRLNSLNEQKKSGFIKGKFPDYKGVIPSLGSRKTIPQDGFEDLDKIFKIAKVADAYNKKNKTMVPVKVGDKYFSPDYIMKVMSMSEKYGLNNIVTLEGNYSPVEFNGDNGSVVIMPMNRSGDAPYFDSKSLTAKLGDTEESEEFLSGDEKETRKTFVKNKLKYEEKFGKDIIDIMNFFHEKKGDGLQKYSKTHSYIRYVKEPTHIRNENNNDYTNAMNDLKDLYQDYLSFSGDLYNRRFSEDGGEDKNVSSTEVKKFFEDGVNKIKEKYGITKSKKEVKKSTIMIRKDVHDDCMDILRG